MKRLPILLPGLLVLILVVSACAQATSTLPLVQPGATGSPLLSSETLPASETSLATAQPSLKATPPPTLIPYESPDWFRQTVLYEIFVRSYRDSDGNGVGDLSGITEQLDYIASLGANAIWLMPIYPSPSVHGYDVSNFFEVNPQYGTLQDLQALVDAAHARGIKVILDFVPSHLSNQHPFFQDAYANPDSDYSDWFVFTNDAQTQYAGFAGNQEMPRFNHYNPEVVDYLSQAALFWLDLDGDGDYTDGIDGFRVDNATFPPQEFLVSLRQAIKSANPNALLLGETWVHNPSDLSRYFQDQFDALFDFPLYELLQGSQDSNGDGLLAGRGFPVLLTTLLSEEAQRYPPEGIPVRFFSNHDTNRSATELSADADRLRLAIALVSSLPHPIMLYYGEEIGMPGQKGGPPYWDNYRREPMDWYADEEGSGQTTWFQPEDRWNQPADGVSVEEQESEPGSLLSFYRDVLNFRRSSAALSEGDLTILELEVSGPGPWGILRLADGEMLVGLFNFSDQEQVVTIQEFPFTANSLVDILTGATFPGSEGGQPYSITMAPAAAIWLVGE